MRSGAPARLWVLAVLNFLSAGIFFIAFASGRLLIHPVDQAIYGILAACLLVASVLGVIGAPGGRWMLLISGVLYFGYSLVQSLIIFGQVGQLLPGELRARFLGQMFGILIRLVLVFWVCFSTNVIDFFESDSYTAPRRKKSSGKKKRPVRRREIDFDDEDD